MAETKRSFYVQCWFKDGSMASFTVGHVNGTALYRALRNAKSNGKPFRIEQQNGKPFTSPKGLERYKVDEIK